MYLNPTVETASYHRAMPSLSSSSSSSSSSSAALAAKLKHHASAYHARVLLLRKIPLRAVVVIGVVLLGNVGGWIAAGVVLVRECVDACWGDVSPLFSVIFLLSLGAVLVEVFCCVFFFLFCSEPGCVCVVGTGSDGTGDERKERGGFD